MDLVDASPPALAISTASAAVAGTGSFDRFFHHATTFYRAKPACSRQTHSDFQRRQPIL
jgi:hypothetical protein